MKLVAEARKTGLQLSVADVFQHPRLWALAKRGVVNSKPPEIDVPPFSLTGNMPALLDDLVTVLSGYGLDKQAIEDAYPCTPLQEGLISLTTRRPGDYVLQTTLRLSPDIDLSRFRAAWEFIVQSCAILRTRIIYHDTYGLLQIVIKEEAGWIDVDTLGHYLEEDQKTKMGLGKPLTQYALVHDLKTSQKLFVWTVHHALYDRTSQSLIFGLLNSIYNGTPITPYREYKYFIRYTLDQSDETAKVYWGSELLDFQSVSFPSLPLSIQEPRADSTLERFCALQPIETPDITMATVVRAAWAMVAHSRSGAADVVFGTTLSGRDAPVAGIESIIGPTIATLPTRVLVESEATVANYLQGIQTKMMELFPYQQTGLQKIAGISAAAKQACTFQTLLIIQPAEGDESKSSSLGAWQNETSTQAFSSYGLTLNCYLSEEGITTIADYDSRILDPWTMQMVLDQFRFLMQALAIADPNKVLGSIDVFAPNELEVLWDWNSKVPIAVEKCLHELFEDQVQARPHAPAIHAWDGALTYSELDNMATGLAHQLVSIGVGPGNIVPLCFEKSMWTSVAMLAVFKAGGAICMLDPTHPESRLRTIVQQ
ncbi:hypothetical protein B5807_12177, partial [Epicoccum nigrum]